MILKWMNSFFPQIKIEKLKIFSSKYQNTPSLQYIRFAGIKPTLKMVTQYNYHNTCDNQ